MPEPLTLDLSAAALAVADVVRRTPLVRCAALDDAVQAPVYLKLESLQVTGSFKVRGAAARMSRLTPAQRSAGVITCSSGNHGRAVSFVADRMGVPATICVPRWVDPVKLEAMRQAGATVEMAGDTYDEAEARAFSLADSRGLTFVHPFDDPTVAAGQGTIALEVLEELPDVARVVVPLSGGGLAGGIGYGITRVHPPPGRSPFRRPMHP